MENAVSRETKKKKALAVSNRKKAEGAIKNMVGLIDVSDNNLNAQLLLNKPPFHKPEAGINPLVDAAAYVFLLLEKMIRIRSQQDLGLLHKSMLSEVKNFQQSIYLSKYSNEIMIEYVPVSSYILCTMIDDIIAATSFGNEGRWERQYSLLKSHELELLSRENFLIILERFIQEPHIYIDIMEFTYICLSVGFKYSCHSSGFDAEQLQRILLSLYKRIRAYRGNVSKQLSPYPLKYIPPALHSENIKSKIGGKLSRLFKKSPRSSTYLTSCPGLMEHIINLENRFQRAVYFLNTRSVRIRGEKIKLTALPWQLFIGSAQSGKSSLLENSRIKYIASNRKDENSDKIIGPKNWNWWVSHESVMIDIGSDYLSLGNIDKALVNKPWEYFLDLIVSDRGKTGLKSVTLVISYSEIMDNVHQHHLIDDLSHRMQTLTEKFGRELSFNLVITKCDLIPGFLNFFSDFTDEELSQAWGARLPAPTPEKSLAELINSRFNLLIKRINNQLIYRLNQEKDFNFQSKLNILGFPLHLEQLKDELGKIIRGFVKRDPACEIKGFYLTSSIQDSMNEANTTLPQIIPGNKFLQSLKIMKVPEYNVQSYFVKQILLYGLISDTHIPNLLPPPPKSIPLLQMLKGK